MKSKAHPINKIVISHSISDEKTTSFLNLDNRVNEEVASYIIDEAALREIIFQETSKLSNINLMHANISEVKLGSDQISVKVNDQILTSKLLVAGDGRKSIIKKLLNIKSVSWDYNQMALSCLIKHTKNNENIAVENFLPTGPIALLPIGNYHSSVIWSVNKNKIDEVKNISIGDLKLTIEEQFKNYTGKVLSLIHI